jgi:hypothetical protein
MFKPANMADEDSLRFLWSTPDDPSVQLLVLARVDNDLRIPENEVPEKMRGMKVSGVLGFWLPVSSRSVYLRHPKQGRPYREAHPAVRQV